MKRIILMTFLSAMFFTACNDAGKKAETSDAKEVSTVKDSKTATYTKVVAGSSVTWRAAHLGGVQPRFGKIFLKSAEVLVNNNILTNASIVMDLGSIKVENFPAGSDENNDLTGHLKNADFFDIAKFPTAKFELTKLESTPGKFNSKVTGNLTIKGVSKSISFAANVKVSDINVGIRSEDFAVDRSDWGLRYNEEGTAGVPANYLIDNKIGFTINVVLNK